MNRLYPLKFKPIIKDKIWGGTRLKSLLNKPCKTDKAGESWEISGYPGSISRVKNGFLKGNSLEELIEVYMGDLVGESVFENFGTFFPLLIKFIDANDVLSIQVHPDDHLAIKQFGSYGKTEMWYVIEAEKDAEIIVGFNRSVSRETYLQHLNDKTLMSILNAEKTFPGDVFFFRQDGYTLSVRVFCWLRYSKPRMLRSGYMILTVWTKTENPVHCILKMPWKPLILRFIQIIRRLTPKNRISPASWSAASISQPIIFI